MFTAVRKIPCGARNLSRTWLTWRDDRGQRDLVGKSFGRHWMWLRYMDSSGLRSNYVTHPNDTTLARNSPKVFLQTRYTFGKIKAKWPSRRDAAKKEPLNEKMSRLTDNRATQVTESSSRWQEIRVFTEPDITYSLNKLLVFLFDATLSWRINLVQEKERKIREARNEDARKYSRWNKCNEVLENASRQVC